MKTFFTGVSYELGGNPVSMSIKCSLNIEMSRLTRDETAEPVSRDQIVRRELGQGKKHFEQDWQPYPVDPYCTLACM